MEGGAKILVLWKSGSRAGARPFPRLHIREKIPAAAARSTVHSLGREADRRGVLIRRLGFWPGKRRPRSQAARSVGGFFSRRGVEGKSDASSEISGIKKKSGTEGKRAYRNDGWLNVCR